MFQVKKQSFGEKLAIGSITAIAAIAIVVGSFCLGVAFWGVVVWLASCAVHLIAPTIAVLSFRVSLAVGFLIRLLFFIINK